MDCTDEESTLFHHTSEASIASSNLLCLYELQQLGELCDVVLETSSNQHIAAHKAVLAASSPYFRSMFVSNFLESTQRKILIKDWDCDILKVIVTYIYNVDFSLPADKVLYLTAAADFFQMDPLRHECLSFLQQKLSINNCLSIRTFAGEHNFVSLLDACTKFVYDHFDEVSGGGEFLELPCDEVKDIISKDEVRVSCEDVVFIAALKWLSHSVVSRMYFFPELLSHVRLPLVSCSLYSFMEGDLFSDQVQVYIQEALTYKKSPEKRHELRASPRIKPRIPSGLKGIFTVGGCTGSVPLTPEMCDGGYRTPLQTVEQYHVDSTNSSTLLCELSPPRSYLAACTYDGYLYAIGGSYGQGKSLDSVVCYNMKEGKWYNTTPMLHLRRYT